MNTTTDKATARRDANDRIRAELDRIKTDADALWGAPADDSAQEIYSRSYAAFVCLGEAEQRALAELAAIEVDGDKGAWRRNRTADILATLTVNADGAVITRPRAHQVAALPAHRSA